MIKSIQLDLEKESIPIPISEPDTAITNSEPPIPTTEEVKLEVGTTFMIFGKEYVITYINKGKKRMTIEPYEPRR